MNLIVQFLFWTVQLSLMFGVVLVLLYAVANGFTQSRSYYKAPRIIRNMTDGLVEFTGRFGPLLLAVFIIGGLVMRLLSLVL